MTGSTDTLYTSSKKSTLLDSAGSTTIAGPVFVHFITILASGGVGESITVYDGPSVSDPVVAVIQNAVTAHLNVHRYDLLFENGVTFNLENASMRIRVSHS